MSTTPPPPDPIATDRDELVEDIYPLPGTDPVEADTRSRDRFSDFLVYRMSPTRAPRKGIVEADLGTITNTVTSIEPAGVAFIGGEPRVHAAVMMAVFVLANSIANGAALHGAFQQFWHSLFPKEKVTEVQRPAVEFETQHNENAEATADAEVVRQTVDEIMDTLIKGGTIKSVTIEGYASDEYRQYGADALGAPTAENQNYAEARANRLRDAVLSELAARGVLDIEITTSGTERILTAEQLQELEALRAQFGYPSVADAIAAYKTNPDATPPALAAALGAQLDDQRGAKVTINTTELRSETVPVPENRDRAPFHFIPLILPPLPLFRRSRLTTTRPRILEIPVSEELAEFVKLYPEAIRDEQLVHGAWKYARKYQNLFRETERIQHVVRLDYVDAQGMPQRLRAVFVDHEPTPHMIAATQRTLEQLSLARGGSVAEDLDMIVIYPSVQAGLHGDPKAVGMGMDIQYGRSTLGVAIPILGIVEMHMDPDTPAELLDAYNGPLHTLVHETLGHFTDVNERANSVKLVEEVTELTVYRTTGTRFADVARDEYREAMVEQIMGVEPRWHIRRIDTTGDQVEIADEVVLTGSPRLAESIQTRKTGFPTAYASTHAGELYAEAVTAEVLGFPIAAGAETGPTPAPEATGRFRASPQMSEIIHDQIGSTPGEGPGLVFTDPTSAFIRSTWQHTSGDLEVDPELMHTVSVARETPLPDHLVGIITPVRFQETDDLAR